RVENSCIQENQAPSRHRVRLWIRSRVQIHTRRDWYFVKLHTHGATEANQRMLLGEPMVQFHTDLLRYSRENPNFRYHYVTAREMYNLACAGEAGYVSPVKGARNWKLRGLSRQRSSTSDRSCGVLQATN